MIEKLLYAHVNADVNLYMPQELKCPLDEFEILLFTARNGKKVSIH